MCDYHDFITEAVKGRVFNCFFVLVRFEARFKAKTTVVVLGVIPVP